MRFQQKCLTLGLFPYLIWLPDLLLGMWAKWESKGGNSAIGWQKVGRGAGGPGLEAVFSRIH